MPRSLESLELCFVKSEKLSSKSLSSLFEGIKCLQSLKKLEVIFWKIGDKKEGFEDNAVLKFLQGLNILKNLEAFRFYDSWKLSQKRRHTLYIAMRWHREKLRHLTNFNVNNVRFL